MSAFNDYMKSLIEQGCTPKNCPRNGDCTPHYKKICYKFYEENARELAEMEDDIPEAEI